MVLQNNNSAMIRKIEVNFMAINDFGAKIGGAKKDLWKARGLRVEDLLEMNEAERVKHITKDNVWAKPYYPALVEDGMPKRVAWFIKTVRDSLPAKPVLGYGDDTPERIDRKQQAYIGFVGDIRDAVMECKTDADILKVANRQWLVDNGLVKAGRGYYVEPTAAGASGITNKFLKAFCLTASDVRRFDRQMAEKQFLFTDEEKALAKYEFYRYADVEWTEDYRGMTQVRVPYGGGIRFLYPEGELADKDSWDEGSYFVMSESKVVGRNFESLDEAKQFVIDRGAGKEAPAKATAKKGKTKFTPKQLAHIERKMSEDYRHGKDMGGEDYMDVFGFKGGEFGNWMSEKDRQVSLNMGYEALLDLAKALQIEPGDISLGGKLSIAFGARGQAGAAAHYEPLREVINLTKMNGAGSLAHEWAHAMDDILGKQLGLKDFMSENLGHKNKNIIPESFQKLIDAMQHKEVSPEEARWQRQKDIDDYRNRLTRYIDSSLFPVKSMTPEQIKAKDTIVQKYLERAKVGDGTELLGYAMDGDGNPYVDSLSALRKEITGRGIPKDERKSLCSWQYHLNGKYRLLTTPARVETEFYRDSQMFDKVHSKTNNGYWQSRVEMFARAFACYVTDKLEGKSDYLSGHSENAVSLAMKNGEPVVIKAIPVGEERKVINRCFDEMIQELKDKGLLHHKEDFTNEVARFQPVAAKPLVDNGVKSIWDEVGAELALPELKEGESQQISFMDLLENAFEKSKASEGSSSGKNIEYEKE